MTTAPPFALRTRTAKEPDQAIRQNLQRLAAGLGEITAQGRPTTRRRS
jgi:hypothetical protein